MVISAVETSGRGTAGHIHAHTLKRVKFFADTRAVGILAGPIAALRFFREGGGDVALGLGHGGAQGIIGLERGGHEFGLGDGELLGHEFGTIESFREFQHRGVAMQEDVVAQDGLGAFLDPGIEESWHRWWHREGWRRNWGRCG